MMLYKNTKATVHSFDGDTNFFDIITVVLQGDTLAPNMFSIYVLYRWFNKGIPQVQAEELASLSESD